MGENKTEKPENVGVEGNKESAQQLRYTARSVLSMRRGGMQHTNECRNSDYKKNCLGFRSLLLLFVSAFACKQGHLEATFLVMNLCFCCLLGLFDFATTELADTGV